MSGRGRQWVRVAAVTSKSATHANSITTASFQAQSAAAANQTRMMLTARQNSGGTSHYRVELMSDSTTARLVKKVSGVDTVLATFTAPAAGTNVRAQLEVSGTTIRAKAWAAGTTPPTGWGASVTDSSLTAAGATQIRAERVAGANTVFADEYTQLNNQSTAPAAFVTNTFNANSQVTNEAFSTGSRAYTYTTGRLTKVVQTVAGANRTTDVTYDTAGQVATTKVGTVTTTYGYDPAGELLSATPSSGSALTWTYDGSGRRTTSKVGTATTTYAYNAASQLTAITPPAGSATSFAYDLAGRRTTETTATTVNLSGFDAAGRLATYTKTASSVVQSSEARGYTPDGLLRTANVTNSTGGVLYRGRMDWDTTSGGVAQLASIGDGATNLGLVRNAGTWAAVMVGPNRRIVGVDVFGSVLNSTSQPLANATSWNAYGQPAGGTASNKATLGYRGELTLGGLTNLRARDYQAANGTFTSIDPLADVPGTPTAGNPYHYTYNDPINRTDPTGMRPGDEAIDQSDAACRRAGGEKRVMYKAVGKMTCLVPPASGTEGALCRPPVDSNGDQIVYKDGYCQAHSIGDACSNTSGRQTAANVFGGVGHVAIGVLTVGFFGMDDVVGSGYTCSTSTAYVASRAVAEITSLVVPFAIAARAVRGANAARAAATITDDGLRAATKAACSFSGDTDVLMADGTRKRIDEVEVGDMVVATDPATGETKAREVVATLPHTDQLVTLETSAGEIMTTEDHRYWNLTDSEWQAAQDLDPGDRLLAEDGTRVVVIGLGWSTLHTTTAYDLDVQGIDTFYVGAGESAVLVHNCNVRSLINSDARLVREAGRAGKSVQPGIDQLTSQLANGNLNPGIGSKNLFGNISYARHRDGARVFFRTTSDGGVEILAKADKANESRVISLLQEIYG